MWSSFIFGLPTDRPDTFQATQELAQRSGIAFAQFVMLTPFCGTVDFERWERRLGDQPPGGSQIVHGTTAAEALIAARADGGYVAREGRDYYGSESAGKSTRRMS